jgi:hypothetical protein
MNDRQRPRYVCWSVQLTFDDQHGKNREINTGNRTEEENI